MIIRPCVPSVKVPAPLGLAAAFVALGAAQSPEAPGDALVAGFKSTYPASVSDAVELVTGRNGTMRHDMKLMTGANLVGRAVTAIAKPAPAEQATPALSTRHSVRDDRRGEARRSGRHRHGRHARHRRDGQSHGHGGRRARHRRDGARRRDSRSLGRAAHGPDGLCAVQVAA